MVVAQCQRTGIDPNRAAVHALQLAGGLHGAQVAADGLLRDTESVRDVDNVDPPSAVSQSVIAW